jgi:predicted acylesterase/phospholipase RssA
MIDRRSFLIKTGAAGLAPSMLGAAPPIAAGGRDFFENSLVLSGGGARGAYGAGIIWQLSRNGGISDGQPLAPYGFVCGTSIGALNGWFVATGQYSKLRNLWYTIGAQNIIRLKPQFDKMTQQTAGVANRLAAALRLVNLGKDEQGVAQSGPVLQWMHREVDESTPLLMPFVWAATDLTTQQPEYFYRLSKNATGPPPEFIFKALRLTVGPSVAIREATDALLHKSLLASASIPFVFDPVTLPAAANDGTTRQYVDGGVAANSPVSIARTVAKSADIVLLDPRLESEGLPSAVDVGLASFGTMQRKILETDLRSTYFQSLAKRAIEQVAPDAVGRLSDYDPVLRTFLQYLPITELAYLRPQKTLPVRVGAFDDQEHINQSFELGMADVARGFKRYDWDTFQY